MKRIVGVSVLGRGTDLSKHAGPVTAAFAKDQAIEESGVDYHALWCPALMDNMLGNLQSIREQGMFSSPSDPFLKVPQVATKDVGTIAAKFLLDSSWYGQRGSAVLGPEDLSFDDVASIMTTVLGRLIRYQQIPEMLSERSWSSTGQMPFSLKASSTCWSPRTRVSIISRPERLRTLHQLPSRNGAKKC